MSLRHSFAEVVVAGHSRSTVPLLGEAIGSTVGEIPRRDGVLVCDATVQGEAHLPEPDAHHAHVSRGPVGCRGVVAEQDSPAPGKRWAA